LVVGEDMTGASIMRVVWYGSQLLEGKVLITLTPANDFKLHFRRRPSGAEEAGHTQGE
jgi:hypothetical protein